VARRRWILQDQSREADFAFSLQVALDGVERLITQVPK